MHLEIKIHIASLERIDTGPTECRTDMQGIDLSGMRVKSYRPYTRPVRRSGTQWEKAVTSVSSLLCLLLCLFLYSVLCQFLTPIVFPFLLLPLFFPNTSSSFFHSLLYFLPLSICLIFSWFSQFIQANSAIDTRNVQKLLPFPSFLAHG